MKKKKKKEAFLSWIALQLWKPIITSVGLQLHQRYYISLSNIFTGLFNSCIISSGWLLFFLHIFKYPYFKIHRNSKRGWFFLSQKVQPTRFFSLAFFPLKKKKNKVSSSLSLSPGNQTQSIHHPSWHAVPAWLMRDVIQAGNGALCGVPRGGSLEAAAVPRASRSPLAQ